jgi:hypothetical protein
VDSIVWLGRCAVVALGKSGHLSGLAFKAEPLGAVSTAISIVAQWCWPSRRQHAGSFDSAFTVTDGSISGIVKIASR